MMQSFASPSAKELMKFYRRENTVGVIRIKLTESELSELQAAYQTAASVPFKMETILLDHQTVQCGEGAPQEALGVRAGSSESGGINAKPNAIGEAPSRVEAADAECPRPVGELK